MRLLDEQHLAAGAEMRSSQFFDALAPAGAPGRRARTGRRSGSCSGSADALVVAGGHVGELAELLHLFHVAPPCRARVVAWSAGAMALTERVVLFHDHVPHGVAQTEVLGDGLGVVPGLVAAAARPAPAAGGRPVADVGAGPAVRAGAAAWSSTTALRVDARPGRPAACGRAGAGPRRPHRHGGGRMSTPRRSPQAGDQPAQGPQAARRRGGRPVPGTRHEVPIVEGSRCTFLFRGEADEVLLVQRIVGLPERMPLRRLRGTDLWYLVLELPEGSRVNYQLEVRRGEHVERFNDPLNPKLSYSPVGHLVGVLRPRLRDAGVDDARPRRRGQGDARRRSCVPSRALRRDCPVTLYLPARFRRTATYPLLVVHDGPDFLQYAAAKTVLDNLIHRLDVAETVVAFLHPERPARPSTPTRPPTPGSSTQELLPRPGDAAAVDGPAVGPLPDGLELRRRRVAVGGGAGPRTPTGRWS